MSDETRRAALNTVGEWSVILGRASHAPSAVRSRTAPRLGSVRVLPKACSQCQELEAPGQQDTWPGAHGPGQSL